MPLAAAVAAAGIALSPVVVLAHDADAHAHHHASNNPTVLSTADYVIPDVKLVRDDGAAVQLRRELDDGRPIVLNFIYTTCTSVCPLTSQTFAQLQDKLGAERGSVHLVSISIDPEQDTPRTLRAYAEKFDAGSEWRFYTGTMAASVAAQRAFNVYRGDKMSHAPVTLVRGAPGKPWVRIEGFATPDELLAELRKATAGIL
jgi:protein SCO1/2